MTWENTWKDIEESGTGIAVVPVGSVEQHGTNLPLASDSLATGKLAEALAEDIGAYLVPLLPIGTSSEHLSFRGTVTLKHDTLEAVISDIVESLVKTGFHTIIIVTMHGGNTVLGANSDFVLQLDRELPGVMVIATNLKHAFDEACSADELTTVGMHADECEASFIASLRPDLVGPEPADFPNPRAWIAGARLDSFGFPMDVREVSPSGSLGEPSRGSKEKGDRFWEVFLRVAIEDVKEQAGL